MSHLLDRDAIYWCRHVLRSSYQRLLVNSLHQWQTYICTPRDILQKKISIHNVTNFNGVQGHMSPIKILESFPPITCCLVTDWFSSGLTMGTFNITIILKLTGHTSKKLPTPCISLCRLRGLWRLSFGAFGRRLCRRPIFDQVHTENKARIIGDCLHFTVKASKGRDQNQSKGLGQTSLAEIASSCLCSVAYWLALRPERS